MWAVLAAGIWWCVWIIYHSENVYITEAVIVLLEEQSNHLLFVNMSYCVEWAPAVSCDTETGWLMARKSSAWECGVGIMSEMIRWHDEGGCQDQQLTSFNIHSFSTLKSLQVFYEICIDVCPLFFSKWKFIFLRFFWMFLHCVYTWSQS